MPDSTQSSAAVPRTADEAGADLRPSTVVQPQSTDSQVAELTVPLAVTNGGALEVPERRGDTNSDDTTAAATPLKKRNSSVKDVDPHAAVRASAQYLELQSRLRSHWTDCPDLVISYEQLTYTVRLPITQIDTTNFIAAGGKALVSLLQRVDPVGAIAKLTGESRRYEDLHALNRVSGQITPGNMTLILAAPGHGKSLFLKALGGILSSDSHLTGEVRYNGLTKAEARARGVHVSKLIQYVAQTDVHFPVLTVKETLDFAATNSNADVSIFHDDELTAMEADRAMRLIHMLGLEEAANTIIGNDLLRGISGGQRKRVTIGEMAITNARVFLFDEVTTGLDAAIAYHIFNAFKQWTRACSGSIVTALLQPTPETYELFDDIILLHEGAVIYHGPRTALKPWFERAIGVLIPPEEDEAGFLVDFLTDPSAVLKTMERKLGHSLRVNKQTDAALVPRSVVVREEKSVDDDYAGSKTATPTTAAVPLLAQERLVEAAVTNAQFVSAWQNSPERTALTSNMASTAAQIQADSRYSLDPSKWSQYSRLQYARPYPHSYLRHFRLAIERQTKLTWRNRTVLLPRLIQAILMGFVYGTLFISIGLSDFQTKMGLLLYIVMFGAFANLSELPIAAEARAIVVKQLDSSFYPTLPYIFSVILLNLPLSVVETIIFGTFMYWIPAFTPDAGRFFFFLLVMFTGSLALSTFFRTISYSTPNPDVARQLDFPFIILFVIFGGFLIPYNEVPRWLIWVYWISPLSWGMRSLAQNEFEAPRYQVPAPVTPGATYANLGIYSLSQFDIQTDSQYKWAGIGYLLGFFLTFSVVSSLTLTYVRSGGQLGTRRLAPVDPKAAENANKELVVRIPVQPQSAAPAPPADVAVTVTPLPNTVNAHQLTPPTDQHDDAFAVRKQLKMGSSFQMNSMPFTPVTLVWKDINYFVTVTTGKKKFEKQLLKGINGFAKPGTLTALMGSSGAGKTTLMDVIAGRKTVGRIEGSILVNGRPKETESFNHLAAYVEQQDLHMGLHTVREALVFSARLRLPSSVEEAALQQWVNDVMALVGLTRVSHRIIGDTASPGLSPGQLKLVTIAVEMVSNPSVLFLDEPTSGLDAPSAYRIMKAVKRITATGRSVLCTIHQPSQELFLMFDRLLLLRSGGQEVFFSDIGPHAEHLVHYLENAGGKAVKNPPRLPAGQNPANFMLDVIGAGVHSDEGGAIAAMDFEVIDYHAVWKESKERAEVLSELTELSDPKGQEDAAAIAMSQKYASTYRRFVEVQKRYFVMHWRNAPTNLTRCILMLINGILLGLIYLKIDQSSFAGLTSFISVIFLGIAFPASVSAASALPSFFRQRAVYYRETTVGMYHFLAYSTAMTIVEIPYIFFALAFFVIPFYFMVGLVSDGTLFFKFYLVVFMQALVYSFLSQLWMALCPSQIASNVINGLFMSLFFMFGGLFIKASAIPTGWKWFYYIDPVPKSFIAAVLPQVYCVPATAPIDTVSSQPLTDTSCPSIEVNGQYQYSYNYLSNLIEGTIDDYWKEIGWLILTLAVIRILNLLCLRFISHLKR